MALCDESFVDRCVDGSRVPERNTTNGYPPRLRTRIVHPPLPSFFFSCPLCARYSAVTESLINIRTVGWPVWLAPRCAAWWVGMHPRRTYTGRNWGVRGLSRTILVYVCTYVRERGWRSRGKSWNMHSEREREREEDRQHSERLRTNCNITIITRPLVSPAVHPFVRPSVRPSVWRNVLTLQRYQRTGHRSRYVYVTFRGTPACPVSG